MAQNQPPSQQPEQGAADTASSVPEQSDGTVAGAARPDNSFSKYSEEHVGRFCNSASHAGSRGSIVEAEAGRKAILAWAPERMAAS